MSKLPKEVQDKLDEYLPSEGPTKYLETEAFRAICKIAHDCDNNGFGNNWVSPFVFLCIIDQLHDHKILGSYEDNDSVDFYKFYELKKYSPGLSIEHSEFNRISDLVNNIYDKVSMWVYNHLDNLTPFEGDMWKESTWPEEFNIDLPDFDNFGDPDEWGDQLEAWRYIVDNGWENFENKNYDPEYDSEYSRYKGRDRYGRW